MEPLLSPVEEDSEVASGDEQVFSRPDYLSHDNRDEGLRARASNTMQTATELRRQTDLPWRRIYQQNELLRIGSTVRNQGIRRIRSAREDLSHLNSNVGPRALRRSASAYSGVLRDTSSHIHEGSTRRNSIQSDSTHAPTRQPINPTGDFDWQRARGFARFIREHASPRHQRVTAGGRIVPALPNTPPPTFHDAFLEAFLQSGSVEQTQLAFEAPSIQHNSINGHTGSTNLSNTYTSTTTTHLPRLKIPPGFRIVQVSADGNIAIAIRGTTTYRYELMGNGQTNCKVVARETKPPVLQDPNFAPTGIVYGTDITHNGYNSLSYIDQSVYGSDPMAVNLTNLAVGHEASHYDTNGLQTWDHVEQELQRNFQPNNGRIITSSYSSSRSRRPSQSMPSVPDGSTWTYQQQLASLDQAIQGWTAMLMDTERVLCFPNVLGHAGVESTRMKRQIMLVKIDELGRKKQQIEAYLASLDAANFAQPGSEDSGQGSSHGLTEADNEGYNDQNLHYNHCTGDIPVENRGLSPLAPVFVPVDQRNPIVQLDGVTVECKFKDGSVASLDACSPHRQKGCKVGIVDKTGDINSNKLAASGHDDCNQRQAHRASTHRGMPKLFIPGSFLKAPSTVSQPRSSEEPARRSTTI